MPGLLIHSMSDFSEIIFSCLEIGGAREIVEIGVEYGAMTQKLLEYAEAREGRLTAVDPSLSPEAEEMIRSHDRGAFRKEKSLDALPGLAADAYLVDGDHNYYTVLRESELIWEQTRRRGKRFLVFYHDVCWPAGRRDQYCAPDAIPEDYRQPHSWDRGVTLDNPGTVEGGFRGEGSWAVALREGGPRNGVLTAVEDFVVGKENALVWACIPAVFGLGILFDRRAPWVETMKRFLLPYHMNPVLERLERNRLENYLAVIEWQDRAHGKCA
jgi:hypothetical protein